MERRLFLYWLIMVLAVMTAVFVVLIVAGVFSNDAGKLGGTLSVQQKNTTMTFNKLIDTLNAQNLALSEQITREVSDVLETEERTFKDLDNNPELITRIEERMCFYLQTIVRSRSCSGAYFILDATTNTEAPGPLQNGAVSAERKCGYGRNGEPVYHVFPRSRRCCKKREYPDAQSLESGI